MSNLLEYSCPNCSSELSYDVEKNDLKCLHCNTIVSIDDSDEVIEENSIDDFNDAIDSSTDEIDDITYRCSKCGQETNSKGDVAFFECQNCGNNVINSDAYKTKAIIPSAIIPFEISKNKAMESFVNWIGKGFWNDSSLKKLSILDNLNGHYVPFWTFDAETLNEWSGQSGTYYYEDEEYTDKDGNTQTRRVQRTRWRYLEGEFSKSFDDILICGSKEITQEDIENIYPFELSELKPFDERYLLGWKTKAFDKDMLECYNQSQEFITSKVEEKAIKRLNDDTYCDLEVTTHYSDETYKHILLPVWRCEYRFKNKKYSFIVNGQNGNIYGNKPLSTSKIVLAVIVIIIIVIAGVMMFNK